MYCLELIAATIRLAIEDYQKLSKRKNLTCTEEDLLVSAEKYLFSKDGLEFFLLWTGLWQHLNIDYVRSQVTKRGCIKTDTIRNPYCASRGRLQADKKVTQLKNQENGKIRLKHSKKQKNNYSLN